MTSSRPIYDTPAQHQWTRVCQCLCPWRAGERVTRVRNLARLVTGLVLGQGIHLSQIARAGPYRVGQAPSQVLQLRRFLDHPRVDVEAWFRPVRQLLLPRGGACTLRMDCSQVGVRHRLLSVGLAFRKRTVPLAWSVIADPRAMWAGRRSAPCSRRWRPIWTPARASRCWRTPALPARRSVAGCWRSSGILCCAPAVIPTCVGWTRPRPTGRPSRSCPCSRVTPLTRVFRTAVQ